MREDGGISWQDAEASPGPEERLRPPRRTIWERSTFPAGLVGSVVAHALAVTLALFGGQIFRADSAGEGTVASVSILTPAEYGALISDAPAVGNLESEPLPAADPSLQFPLGRPAELDNSRDSPTLSQLPVEPVAPTGNEPPQWVPSGSTPIEQASNQPSITRPPARSAAESGVPEVEAAKPVVSVAETGVVPNEVSPLAVPPTRLPEGSPDRERVDARKLSVQPSQAAAAPTATADPAGESLPVLPRGAQGGLPVVLESGIRNQPAASLAGGPDLPPPQATTELDGNLSPSVPLLPPSISPPIDRNWTRSDLAAHTLPPSIGAAGDPGQVDVATTIVAAAPLPVADPATQPRPPVARDAPVSPRPFPEPRDQGRPDAGLAAGPGLPSPRETDEPDSDSVPSLPRIPPSVAESSDSAREGIDLGAQLLPRVGTAVEIHRDEAEGAQVASAPPPVDDSASQLPPVVSRNAPEAPEPGSRNQPDAVLASGPDLSSPRDRDAPDASSVASLPLRPPPGAEGREGIDFGAQPPPAISSAAEIGEDEDRPELFAAVPPTVSESANQPLPLITRDAPEAPEPGERDRSDAVLASGPDLPSPRDPDEPDTGSVASLPLRSPPGAEGREGIDFGAQPPPAISSAAEIGEDEDRPELFAAVPPTVNESADQPLPLVTRDAPEVPEPGNLDRPDAVRDSGPDLSSPRDPDEPDTGSVASLPLRPPPGAEGREGIDFGAQPPPAISSAAEIGEGEDRPELLAAVPPTVNESANPPSPLVIRDAPEVPGIAPNAGGGNQPDAGLAVGAGLQSPSDQGSIPSLPLLPPSDDPGREGVDATTGSPLPPGVASVGDVERVGVDEALEAQSDNPVEAQISLPDHRNSAA